MSACAARDGIGGEHQGPGTAERIVPDVAQRHERAVGVELPLERILDEVVEAGDRVQVDRSRPHAQRVFAGVERSERDLDERRGRGDLDVAETERTGQREHLLFEIGGRVAGVVPGACEPEQELRGGVGRRAWLLCASRAQRPRVVGDATYADAVGVTPSSDPPAGLIRFQTMSSPTARSVIATMDTNVSGSLRSVSTAKKPSTIAVAAIPSRTIAAEPPVSDRSR